ncbi:MAG: hypothetical protein Q4C98_03275, partial [Capnocytophaga sp.]|nr:hypothetical protein [Capnocytophaga sp.]
EPTVQLRFVPPEWRNLLHYSVLFRQRGETFRRTTECKTDPKRVKMFIAFISTSNVFFRPHRGRILARTD